MIMVAPPTRSLLERIEREETILYGLTRTFSELRPFEQALMNSNRS